MVKSKTETIQAISDNVAVGEKTILLTLFKTIFHLSFVVHFLWAGVYGTWTMFTLTEEQLREPMIAMMKNYSPCYVTIWNASFQTMFLGLALLHDMLRWLDKHESKIGRKVKYFRDVIFNGLVFPFTCFVTGMFWCVYLIDRELVFPQVYDQIVPWWLNHCVHTNIFIVIAIETLLTRRRQPTDVKVERCLWVFVSVFYAVVYYSIYFFGGCWLYGVFGVMTWWQVCIYQACIWGSTWVFYNLNFFVNRMIHKEADSSPKTSTNGDLESRETTFQNTSKVSGVATVSKNKDVELNAKDGMNENGKTNAAYLNENNDENGKEWTSIGKDGQLDKSGTNFKRNQSSL
ncbi:androgen-dependent TFPI-regulating protein-like isoform X2 [Leguminivora glycinivorella]|uniref:androgen-dependent TFPI-regulating protein-like isoform X2 n=1 Tax=Leguminivora glycinivorella TaxID=1035111 RepID=UPI00200D0EB7|nr:androgen-dependent TFPI-regulating protein-like isoform X2 [Leguminivora glycinivorella]